MANTQRWLQSLGKQNQQSPCGVSFNTYLVKFHNVKLFFIISVIKCYKYFGANSDVIRICRGVEIYLQQQQQQQQQNFKMNNFFDYFCKGMSGVEEKNIVFMIKITGLPKVWN